MKKINILQIGTGDKGGGAFAVSYNLKKELEKLGHTTSMFVGQKRSTDNNVFLIKKRSKTLDFLSKLIKKNLETYLNHRSRYLIANDIDFFKSDKILKTKEFKNADIVHCHNLHGNFFKLKTLQKISKLKPLVWTLHDMCALTGHCAWARNADGSKECQKWQSECKNCPFLNVYQPLAWDNSKYLFNKKKEIYDNSKLNIVPVSNWLNQKLKKSILKNHHTVLIHNGINDKIFKPYDKQVIRKELNIPPNKKVIIFISKGGKNNIRKGWQYNEKIIKYYKNNKNILFLCVGGNKEDKKYNNEQIKYIEFISDESQLAKYYAASDIFLFTSLAENFPLVILEAMSTGLPIVSFDVGGVCEAVIHKKNGYIAKYRNLDDLINGVKYILNLSEKENKEISKNSIIKVQNYFTLDIMIRKYLDLYKKILENNSSKNKN